MKVRHLSGPSHIASTIPMTAVIPDDCGRALKWRELVATSRVVTAALAEGVGEIVIAMTWTMSRNLNAAYGAPLVLQIRSYCPVVLPTNAPTTRLHCKDTEIKSLCADLNASPLTRKAYFPNQVVEARIGAQRVHKWVKE